MDYYSDDDDGGVMFSDDHNNIDYAQSSAIPHNNNDKPFTILNENDIQQRQDHEIAHISSVLSISKSHAGTLLHHYRWNVSLLHDEWFSDEAAVRAKVGIFGDIQRRKNLANICCLICFDEFSEDTGCSVGCHHFYCRICWKGYISTSIDETGPGCLSLRCPDPGCKAAVGKDMVDEVGTREEREKYETHFRRSYVEGRKDTARWCPAPGCENAVELELGSTNVYDVVCQCCHVFCWNCVEDAHRPVDCDTVAKWLAKNCSEAENTNWILAYSKPCPKCKRPIEKNLGCNHMTCSAPCKYEFCWLCLGNYKNHGMCNQYKSNKRGAGWSNDDERKRIMAKESLERYTHYYERWASNDKSRNKAMEDLNKMQTVYLKYLSDRFKESEMQLNFIIEAWQQIVECRRVLKWTYAYGYYIPKVEDAKMQLFECLQGEAEAALERLHRCAERELADNFLNEDNDRKEDFGEFRPKLVGLTRVTRLFFENLVRALENGLSEAESSRPKAKSNKKRKGSTSNSSNVGHDDIYYSDDEFWNCDRCTYLNPGSVTTCVMCFEGH